MSNTITVKNFATNLDRLRVPLSSFEREKRKGNIPYYGAAKIIDYVDGFTHTGLSVLIAEDGSVETKDGYPVVQLANGQYWVNNHTHVLKGKDDIDTIYLYYALQTIKVAPFVTGAVQKKISQQALNSIEIPYFEDKSFRKIIVNILSKFDEKIQLNTQINQTLEQIAQAIFKSWFVDFDPVRAKAATLASGKTDAEAELAAMQAISGKTAEEPAQMPSESYAELAEIAKAFPSEFGEDGVPMGWEVKPLDKIAHYQNGLALQKFRPKDDEPFLPVVKIAQLRQGYADSEERATANIKPECIIDNGDVVFSWSGSLLVDIWCGGKAALNQHLFKVTSENYPKWFYYFYTKHHLAEFQRIAYDKAVTMGHIKREHLSLAMCVVPNNELLQNKVIDNLLEKIILNRLENFNLQNTRDLLLPRLLNGDL
ncbi:restriction endonuclease subunit S [Aggregatibacter actinomycetemcomitans]|uniref:restriction endonuclease subunit S n=1 Tax=Aggregatibacter actinomycetemcomitans TaxID=714 RepID=UPI00023FF48E|nr:restriction endonuclease subunit S [Aggregatibacter actinomycetemcomitans]EHK91016.1 putative type I restriction enzyme HindVIIP specificity protein [Aggregatibacter actinomycetemcomitans RhAA1]